MSEPWLAVRGLRFVRPESGFTLEVDALEVAQGQAAAVVGPSGSGKSTLLGLLSGELVPQHGEVWLAGRRIDQASWAQRQAWRLAKVGMVFQASTLVPHLDALDNVLLPFRIGELPLTPGVRTRGRQLLEQLGLGELVGRLPRELSGGECRRVAIARALVAEPVVLLADEPTTGLDAAQTEQAVSLLQDVARDHDASLVVVTHDLSVRARFPRCWELP
jgi:ABC-type lipoprotein export system ATPase subunit